jgi:hypothetical protein
MLKRVDPWSATFLGVYTDPTTAALEHVKARFVWFRESLDYSKYNMLK